jgi:hypothetical protein
MAERLEESILPNVLGSACAGIIARISTHPLDTTKARLQAQSAPRYRGPVDALAQTARAEGITGLYRGFGAVIIGGTPGTVLYLCSYDFVKKGLSQAWESRMNQPMEGTGADFAVHFTAGMLAETIACIIYVPVDVVKERMQVQQGLQSSPSAYKSSWDAFQKIARSEGITGIYKGYTATLGSFGPFSALYFVFYEKLKRSSCQYVSREPYTISGSLGRNTELPFPWVVGCSAGAGALASWLTSPLDMAKLRLQVQRGHIAQHASSLAPVTSYRGVWDCLKQAHKRDGFRGLFRGAGARVLHFAPATTITMTSYEMCRSLFAGMGGA